MLNGIEQGIGDWVVVRTYSAGVHYGRLYRLDGNRCVLTAAKRVFRWIGANTLNELANTGCDSGKISKATPWILLEWIEIQPLADVARGALDSVVWST